MSTEQEWGAPPPPRRQWSPRRAVVAAVVAVGIAAAGGAAIYAASGSAAAQGPGGGPGHKVIHGPMGDIEETQHGEFQVGKVTELSKTSITARSEDGFTRTYVVGDDTAMPDDVAKGDTVTIVATTEDGTATAKSVMAREDRLVGPGGPGGPPPPEYRQDGN